MKKETVFYYTEENSDWSDEFPTYKEAVEAAEPHVTSNHSPEIWKRERVAVISQELVVTKTK